MTGWGVSESESTHIYLPMKMEQTECSETSAYKIQTLGNYPKESIQLALPFMQIVSHVNSQQCSQGLCILIQYIAFIIRFKDAGDGFLRLTVMCHD